MYQKLRDVLLLCAGYLTLASFSTTTATDELQPWIWGPYRPNLYFGLRPQIPETLLVGLMWANGDNVGSMLQCESHHLGHAGNFWGKEHANIFLI